MCLTGRVGLSLLFTWSAGSALKKRKKSTDKNNKNWNTYIAYSMNWKQLYKNKADLKTDE